MINLKLITLNKEETYERRTLQNFTDHKNKSNDNPVIRTNDVTVRLLQDKIFITRL